MHAKADGTTGNFAIVCAAPHRSFERVFDISVGVSEIFFLFNPCRCFFGVAPHYEYFWPLYLFCAALFVQ